MRGVLCIDQYPYIGGGQRSLLDLLPAFAERGWRPEVAAPRDGPLTQLLQKNGYRTHHVDCGSYSIKKKSSAEFFKYACAMPALVKALDRAVGAHNSTLLYVNGPRLLPPAAWVAKRRGIPVVFHCHNRLLQNAAITLTGEALKLAKAQVIGCCQYAADPLRKYIPSERLSVIFNGVEEMALPRRRPQEKIRRIGVVGRVEMEKGQVQFVEAARIVLQSVNGCTFTIVGVPMFSGEEYYKRVVALSQGLPLEFLGWRDNVREVYADLDLLVVPSSAMEATTRVILEAYSAGVPVVAFPRGGIPEVLKDNETGFLTDDMTSEALARRILSILKMEMSSVEAVVSNARREWCGRYTVEAYRQAVCSVVVRGLTSGGVNACQNRQMNPEVRAQQVLVELQDGPREEQGT